MEGLVAYPVAELTSREVADALTRAFEGYLPGPVDVDARAYERRFRAEDLDPFVSRVYRLNRSVAGILLVARRGWTSRIAGMGVAPTVRGRGLGRLIVTEALREARARGDRSVLLEVFERNTPAVRLYQKLGFRAQRRLIGYRREPGKLSPGKTGTLTEADPLGVARIVAREGERDLPWMLAAETISAITSPARAYHLDHRAYAVIENPETGPLVLATLIVRQAERRKGWGSRLLHALEAEFPDRPFFVPAIVPEGPVGTFLVELGWEPEPLSQSEMVLKLPQAA